jgi:hypothetical protein
MKLQNNFILGLLALTAAGMVSCSSDEPAGSVYSDSTEAITLDAYVARNVNGSRAAEGSVTSLQSSGIGVFAYYNDGKDYANSASTVAGAPNFMKDLKVSYEKTAWTYSPTRYWSKTASDYYQFLAYAPYDSAHSGITSSSAPVFSYNAIKSNFDFMTAINKDQQKPTDGSAVKFNFKHRLCRLGIIALTKANYSGTNNDGATITVTSAVIKGMSTVGTYSLMAPFASSSPSFCTDGWTVDETQPESYTALSSKQKAKTLSTSDTNLFNDGGYLFAIPTKDNTIVIDITYEINQDGVIYKETASLKRSSLDLLMGHGYNFVIKIGLDSIDFTVETIEVWGTGDRLEGSTPANNNN